MNGAGEHLSKRFSRASEDCAHQQTVLQYLPATLFRAAPGGGLRCAVHGYGVLAKEELKSLLFEMMVVAEDLGEAMASHDVHGDTVRQAIVFVWSSFIERETLEERFMGLRNHRDVWVGENMARQIDGALPRTGTERATDGQKLV
jgi:hypothetical protein